MSKYEISVLVIEKEIDVGMCPSSANSAIIHSGLDPRPSSLKAKLNVEGNRLWEDIAGELGIQFKKTGSFVVAIGKEEFSDSFKALRTGSHQWGAPPSNPWQGRIPEPRTFDKP